jgi:hypothetical protein
MRRRSITLKGEKMSNKPSKRAFTSTMSLALLASILWAPAAGADTIYRAKGTGSQFWISWTEFDPDDLLRLPGNVHVGYLSGYDEQYGTFLYGNVTDFDCDPGEVPGGGGHGGEAVIFEGQASADAGEAKALDKIIASGAKTISAEAVVDGILTSLDEDVPEFIEEEFPPACDYIQDRFLGAEDEGVATATFTVDSKTDTLTVSGYLVVSNGGHGEPGTVLGRPPINLTVQGGDWQKYESSYKGSSADYSYSYWQKGTDLYGGTVSGAIGGMGFADDEDDESFAGFGSFSYMTVEHIRF